MAGKLRTTQSWLFFKSVPAEIVVVQTLHDDDDRTIFVCHPVSTGEYFCNVVDMLALGVRGSIGQFQRIINDYDMAAATG